MVVSFRSINLYARFFSSWLRDAPDIHGFPTVHVVKTQFLLKNIWISQPSLVHWEYFSVVRLSLILNIIAQSNVLVVYASIQIYFMHASKYIFSCIFKFQSETCKTLSNVRYVWCSNRVWWEFSLPVACERNSSKLHMKGWSRGDANAFEVRIEKIISGLFIEMKKLHMKSSIQKTMFK